MFISAQWLCGFLSRSQALLSAVAIGWFGDKIDMR